MARLVFLFAPTFSYCNFLANISPVHPFTVFRHDKSGDNDYRAIEASQIPRQRHDRVELALAHVLIVRETKKDRAKLR